MLTHVKSILVGMVIAPCQEVAINALVLLDIPEQIVIKVSRLIVNDVNEVINTLFHGLIRNAY